MSDAATKPPRKQKQKEPRSQPPSQSGAERLKIVVRCLPPNLPEDVFWQSVQQWVTDDTVNWKTFCRGKLRTKQYVPLAYRHDKAGGHYVAPQTFLMKKKRLNKEGIPSRAYIAFKSEEQVAMFSREYNGHVFRDKAGNESCALVEFAPFQKAPSEKKKVDARNNTIDKDDDYISFCETLKNAPKNESVSLEALIAAAQPPPPPTTTPLLEALRAEKSAQKDKEAILRNHPHYKDAIVTGSSLKKEEIRKKAVAPAKPPPLEPPTLSKKAKKAAAAQAAAAAASQKSSTQQAQESGKSQLSPPAAPSTPKSQTPVTIVPSRRPKDPHGRPRSSKGDMSTPVPASATGTTKLDSTISTPVVTENTEAPSAPPTPRGKGRPMIGLGRQFEAALNGAGVAVVPVNPGSDRKKRDKGEAASSGNQPLRTSVPSILQRPDTGARQEPVVAQHPQSREGGHGEGVGRGRRGRARGRGRGD